MDLQANRLGTEAEPGGVDARADAACASGGRLALPGALRTALLVVAAALAVAACGDDSAETSSLSEAPPQEQEDDPPPPDDPPPEEEDDDPPPEEEEEDDPPPPEEEDDPPPAAENSEPTISGTPQSTAMQDTSYDFTPSASDDDGDTLTFSVANLPAWASFDDSTGAISGTPGPGDVGTYADIRITVSDGTASASLAAFSIDVVSTASGSATLSWTAPTERSDGTELGSALAGFKVYWGPAEGDYRNSVTIDNPGVSTYVVDGLTPATWYFVATAYDEQGVESQFSPVVSKTVD